MMDDIMDSPLNSRHSLNSMLHNPVDLSGCAVLGVSKSLSSTFENCVKGEDSGGMRVFLRVRPTINQSTAVIDNARLITITAPELSKRAQYSKIESNQYAFTRVFGPDTDQETVFKDAIEPFLERLIAGGNCALFAYGMTNSGKTHTIQGCNNNPGIMPRLVSGILERLKGELFSLNVSMLEIYQENIYDLLSNNKKREKLSIRDANGRVEVSKLSTQPVKCAQDAVKLMDLAASKRTKSSTMLNTGSSRSHALYTVTLNRSVNGKDTSTAFQLIDLAGAERGNRTNASAAQQKEANHINTSLMQMWRCLQGVNKNNRTKTDLSASMEVIPFRESKLTHLLMPILCRAGMLGVGMVACVNPQVDDYDETLSIMKNASLASKIKEISDVGRTAATQLDQQADASAAAAAVVAKVGPSAKGVINIKEMNHTSDRFPSAPPVVVSKKRGRTDSTVTSVSAKNSKAASSSLSRDSAAALKKLIKTKAPTKKVSMAVAAVVVAEMPSVLPDQDSFGCDGADGEEAEEQQDEDTEEQTSQLREAVDHGTISSVKRRRVEQVEELANLGYDIHGILFSRECEVREEVSNEMGLIICGLNKELNEERDKIHSLKHGHATDFSKSCKKVKRAQLDAMEARRVNDAAHDLRLLEEKVAEDEQAHAEEVAALQTENCALKARNAQLEAHITALLQKEAAPMPTAMAIAAAPAQTSQTETEYSRRFGKRNDENAALSNALGKPAAIVIVKSPLRAPLSPLSKHMDNKAPVISPVFVKHSVAGLISAYSSGKPPVASAKKEQNTSPQRVRGAALAAGLSSEQPARVTRQKAAGLR